MVNAILPGYMLTDMGTSSGNKAKDEARNAGILKTFSSPASVAEFICSLSGISGVTGQVFNLDSRII